MSGNNGWSLAVTGKGILMGGLLAELTRSFPEAKLYDRSSKTNRLRGAEATLGKQGLLQSRDRAWAGKVAKSLAAPPSTDITVDFRTPVEGGPEAVTVSSRRGSKRLTFQFPSSIMELDLNVRRIVTVIGALK